MERVVYILGAGFSAPLGIPVMSNFLEKSKDQFSRDPDQHQHFSRVFDAIDELSVIKHYYESEQLFNIEEVLSLLDMTQQLEDSDLGDLFKGYISDVVEEYTPSFVSDVGPATADGSPATIVATSHGDYAAFVACLLGLRIEKVADSTFLSWKKLSNPSVRYDVISFNYDRVLELLCSFLRSRIYTKAPAAGPGVLRAWKGES